MGPSIRRPAKMAPSLRQHRPRPMITITPNRPTYQPKIALQKGDRRPHLPHPRLKRPQASIMETWVKHSRVKCCNGTKISREVLLLPFPSPLSALLPVLPEIITQRQQSKKSDSDDKPAT